MRTKPKRIDVGKDGEALREAAGRFREARYAGALTGAGVSVESGIPDFRSPGGLWTRFDPQEYATITTFLRSPEKSWVFFRELGRTLEGPRPNAAHEALSRLEEAGFLNFVITQNIDGLHEAAGSREVVAVHGDNRFLQCLSCDSLVEVRPEHFLDGPMPRCGQCGAALKPRVVLFGEAILDAERCMAHLAQCDALLVVGTSAQVYPVADFPRRVSARNGPIYEFNLEETPLTRGSSLPGLFGTGHGSTWFFQGRASLTVSAFVSAVLEEGASRP